MENIKAVIFDLDGVIVDTARYHFMAWQRLARELGFEFTEIDNERLKGVSRMDSLAILLEIGGLFEALTPEDRGQLASRKNCWYLEYIARMTPADILPGVREFLHQVREDGMHAALGSSSRNARTILERIGLTSEFDVVVDGNMIVHAKPHPEVFLQCAYYLGISPHDCVVFEDAEAGIEAARRGEMRVVGVGSPVILRDAEIVIPDLKTTGWPDLKKRLMDKH